MAAKRRKIVEEDFDLGFGATTIPTDSNGIRAASKFGLHSLNRVISVERFGAVASATRDNSRQINDALAEASAEGFSVYLPPSANGFAVEDTLIVPAGVRFFGEGRKSKIVSRLSAGYGELVKLSGDYASIRGMWLRGIGQGDGSAVNGSRGIWIGAANNSSTASNYCRVTDMIIDQFEGNGISGAYSYSEISRNIVVSNTDANIFIPPTCTNNLIEGNVCNLSKFSGIDCNGSSNRVIGNVCDTNGGGSLDSSAWNGILVTSVDNSNPAVLNLVEGNRCAGNLGCGIVVYGVPGASTTPPYGNIVKGNICSGHTNTTSPAVHLPCGIGSFGGHQTIIEGNACYANRDNYIISGAGTTTSSKGVIVAKNQSTSATRYGFFFSHTPRIDSAGIFPLINVHVEGNIDRLAATDSFRVTGLSTVHQLFKFVRNVSDTPGAYCFNNTAPTLLTGFEFEGNYGAGFGTGFQSGFDAPGFGSTDATPTVANGNIYQTNNASATTITDFDDTVHGQKFRVLVGDNNTTFDFTGTNLKGNCGADFIAQSGDFIDVWVNGSTKYCNIHHLAGYATGASSGVTQLTNKSTGVTLNALQGNITMNNAALGSDAEVSFTLTNSYIGANDHIRISVIGGIVTTLGAYIVTATAGSGSATIILRNVSGGSLSDAVILGFEVIKQV